MTAKNSDILTAARRLISDPKNWTTGWLARDGKGKEVAADDPFACSWCAFGAVMRSAKIFGISGYIGSVVDPLDVAASKIQPRICDTQTNFRPIIILNDRLKDHDSVLRAYDLAIKTEKAREETEALEQTGKADA